jgi:mono/diheme cytochrome c family protein
MGEISFACYSIFLLRLAHPAIACPMPFFVRRLFFVLRIILGLLVVIIIPNSAPSQQNPSTANTPALLMHTVRTSPLDLEIAGDLLGAPAGESRYLTREQLLALPQVTYTVEDDPNFTAPAQITGVLLNELTSRLSSHPDSDLIVAICSDLYRGYYPREYLSAHQPILVLTINNLPPSGWPKDSTDHSTYKGPFLISHPNFVPSFHILSHADIAQIPWGVVRLEFHDEKKTFDAIAPRGPHAESVTVQDGFHIAQQNCLRCHNQGKDGGMKAGRSWQILSSWAAASPDYFSAYLRNPKSKNPHSNMPGFPEYDDATVLALISYFRTFTPSEKQ